jgi:DNA-binding NarL/FixJ family response regulator
VDDGYVRATRIALPTADIIVLGLLIDGNANQRIARTLYITERTVAAHLEHIGVRL